MQVYLATMESGDYIFENMPDDYIEYGLVSFFYLKEDKMPLILSKCKNLLVDSGAFSFQKGKKNNFNEYMMKYIEFIKKYTDNPKIAGFFEMDIDNIIGYDKVLELREKLEQVSDKIIPVWHNNRGVDDFHDMCEKYSGKKVSISCVSDKDILPGQYNLFINTAHSYGCNIHLLGLTRFSLIKQLNLGKEDSFDSSTWKQNSIYGAIGLVSRDLEFYRLYSTQGMKAINKNGEPIYFKAERENFLAFKKLQDLYKEIDNTIYLSNDFDKGNDLLIPKNEWVDDSEIQGEEIKTLKHPIVEKAFQRILEIYKPKHKVAIVSLCTATRPYSKSRKWKTFIEKFGEQADMIICSNGGIIPIEFENSYPYLTYDAHGQNKYNDIYNEVCLRRLLEFFNKFKYEKIILNFRPGMRNRIAGEKFISKYSNDTKVLLLPTEEVYGIAKKNGFPSGKMFPDLDVNVLQEIQSYVKTDYKKL